MNHWEDNAMHYTYNKKTRNKNLLNKAFFNLHWLIHSFFCSLACSHANAAEILVEAISKRIENGATNDGNEMDGAIGGQSSVVKICSRSLINKILFQMICWGLRLLTFHAKEITEDNVRVYAECNFPLWCTRSRLFWICEDTVPCTPNAIFRVGVHVADYFEFVFKKKR